MGREDEFRVNMKVDPDWSRGSHLHFRNTVFKVQVDSYAQVGTKDRSLDIREEILEGDMDLGATQPSLVLLEILYWRYLGSRNGEGKGFNKKGWERTGRGVLGVM